MPRDPDRLRSPRLNRLKAMVPEQVKRVPKAWQARAMSAAARRMRANASPSEAILVVSTPRSGSTWLFELLAADPDVLPLFEPLHPMQNPRFAPFADALGDLAVPATEADDVALRHLVREVYAGRALTRWSTNRAPLGRIRHARRTLIKEVHASRALGWLMDVAPVPVVVLVRHPCAVVESMMRTQEAWTRWTHEEVMPVVRQTLGVDGSPRVVPGDRPAFLAALWADDVRCAIDATRGHSATAVVAYEDLVVDPNAELERIAAQLDLRPRVLDPHRPSYTTLDSSPLRRGGDPLTSWREGLPADTVATIVETVHRLGVPLYTEDPWPDRPALTQARG